MSKYWDDADLMAKLSAKLRAMNIGPQPPMPAAQPQARPLDKHETTKQLQIPAFALDDGSAVQIRAGLMLNREGGIALVITS